MNKNNHPTSAELCALHTAAAEAAAAAAHCIIITSQITNFQWISGVHPCILDRVFIIVTFKTTFFFFIPALLEQNLLDRENELNVNLLLGWGRRRTRRRPRKRLDCTKSKQRKREKKEPCPVSYADFVARSKKRTWQSIENFLCTISVCSLACCCCSASKQ